MILSASEKIAKIKVTEVWEKTNEASQWARVILEEGGSRSSKTWSIFQFFIIKALQGEEFVLTTVRANLSWIRLTLLKDFKEIVEKYEIEVTPEINLNRADQIYYINGSEFGFFGLDHPEKVHGRKQTYYWFNEVMEIANRQFFDQIEMRTTKFGILDYNPSDDEHWAFDVAKRPDVAKIKSTMLDNPFLEKPIIDKILSYDPNNPKNVENGTADLYMWEVYGLGNPAKLQGAIFNNWDIIDDLPRDDAGVVQAKFICYGLDFGYQVDPTALTAIYTYNQEIILDEMLYETGLTNVSIDPNETRTIVNRFEGLDISKHLEIIADSSEPKSIEEIRRAGYAIKGAIKGPDSVKFGLDVMLGYKIHITKRSVNLEKEFRRYHWATDRNGKPLNVPVDEFNHGIDGSRYGISTKLRRNALPTFHSAYGARL